MAYVLNPLNAELNPIFHLLALLGVYHFLYVSRIRVNIYDQIPISHTSVAETASLNKVTIIVSLY
jgi:hypothetical protein